VTTSTQAHLYVKDLSSLGRNLSHTLIIDNSITAFGFHLDSGIPIPSFYGQASDSEFIGVLNILESLLRCSGSLEEGI
jgi:CTD small phosphatase-like protein 2